MENPNRAFVYDVILLLAYIFCFVIVILNIVYYNDVNDAYDAIENNIFGRNTKNLLSEGWAQAAFYLNIAVVVILGFLMLFKFFSVFKTYTKN